MLVSNPNAELPITEFPNGVANVAWFKTLKNSARNWSVFDSVIRLSLMTEKSRFDQLGVPVGKAPDARQMRRANSARWRVLRGPWLSSLRLMA